MAFTFQRNQANSFPPYHLLSNDYLRQAEAKSGKLEHLYHKTQTLAWDGKKVLAELLKKHGGIRLDQERRGAIARIFGIILWGELAAWNVSADLALSLEDVEAKMAATGQVFDEARHFYTMRDYLLELDVDIPPLDGYTLAVLRELLATRNLTYKLLGMQLLIENVAVNLFRTIAAARVEPVLSDLMPYFERDEARHVGLGVMYLPKLLANISPLESARLKLFQLRINTLIIWGTRLMHPQIEKLGIDHNVWIRQGLRQQTGAMRELRQSSGGRVRGILASGSQAEKRVNEMSIDLFFPPPGVPQPHWQRTVLRGLFQAAKVGDRVLRMIS